jgi:hypothetical protein
MKTRYLLIGAALAALSTPALAATNILPGSGDTVVGSSIHDGFDASVAAGNLINGTSNSAYGANGDPRWVFADGTDADETLTVDLGVDRNVFSAGFAYNGQDRIPTSFSVLTSTDGVNFTLVAGPSLFTPADYGLAGIYTTEYSFTPTSAKYVEIDFGSNSIGGFGGGGGAGNGAGIYQLYVDVVPEPATWAMLMVGFGGIGAVLRSGRRRLVRASAA